MATYFGDNTSNDYDGTEDQDFIYGYGDNDYLHGLGGDDFIVGGSGYDYLDGGEGDDSLLGGDDNDLFFGGEGADVISGGDGRDLALYGSNTIGGITINLMTGKGSGADAEGDTLYSIEDVWATSYDDNLIGSNADNSFDAGNGQNYVEGLGGDDVISTGNGDDQISGGTGADTLSAGGGIDWISYYNSASGVYVNLTTNFAFGGEAQGDIISGFENLAGGYSSDTLYGSNVANIIRGNAGDDYIWAGAGLDTIYGDAGVDTLGYEGSAAGVVLDLELAVGSGGDAQADIFTGIENLNGTSWVDSLLGNSLRNVFHSGSGMDTLNGRDGNDELHGGNAADTITGGAGDDELYGDAGADTMIGGLGNDEFYVDNAGDVVTELAGQGTDKIYSAVSYTIAAGVETLQLTGAAAINATGLAATANTLIGNTGANVISGLGGSDILIGGLGIDTLIGGTEGDLLIGGLGNDTLTGGTGTDLFRFDTALGATNKDTITDFSVPTDTIQLDNAIFASLGAAGPLGATLFKNLNLGAQDANDRILYNDTTGVISYDADGLGGAAAVQFATLTGSPTITAADFAVI